MIWLLIAVVLVFGLVVVRGAPFIISHKEAIERAFEMLDLKPGSTIADLGSGSGAVLEAAARRGIYAVGYELNPLLVIYSRIKLWPHRDMVSVHWADFWNVSLPKVDAVYLFAQPRLMKKLENYFNRQKSPFKVISYAAPIPGKKPLKHDFGLFLYQF